MGVYFRLHPATGGVPACRGSGEIDDSEREGISVFPEEDGLYRYMAARDVADAKLLLLEGEATGDTDFDADEGAVLITPTRVVDVRDPDLDRSRHGGGAPEEVARRWDTPCGFRVEAPPERDLETLDRIRAVREATSALHER
jgi:hypothetical protein